MDEDLPPPEEPRVLLPGAPIPADGIGAYPLFLHSLGVALRHMPTLLWIYLPVAAVATALLFVGAPTFMSPDPTIPRGELQIPLNEWIAVSGSFLFMVSFGARLGAAVFRSAHAALTAARAHGFGAGPIIIVSMD